MTRMWLGMAGAAAAVLAWGAAADVPRAELLAGLTVVAAPGVPGDVVLLGSGAVPLVVGRTDAGGMAAVVAAAQWQRGRVVAFGHTSYLTPETARGDTGELFARLARWAARPAADGSPKPPAGVRVLGIGVDAGALLGPRGFALAAGAPDLAARLAGADLVLLSDADLDAAERAALAAYVTGGGGLLAAQTGWGWRQIHAGRSLREHGPTLLLQPAGLAWGDATPDRTAAEGFAIAGDLPAELALPAALDLLLADAAPAAGAPAAGNQQARLQQAADTAVRAVRVLPEEDPAWQARLAGALEAALPRLATISESRPLKRSESRERFLLAYQLEAISRLPAAEVPAHPAAAQFPGSVPADAARVGRTVEIDLSRPRWHSTGLYAPAGAVVRATVESGAAPRGLALRIGCHTDSLWHHASWKRVPEITLRTPMGRDGRAEAASAFGGLIYLDVPAGTKGALKVRVEGAVEAPRFVLGRTTPAEWAAARVAPAPWAELETETVVVSVPSAAVRGLEDPSGVLRAWEEVLDAAADLATIPRRRAAPERYVADVQISAGYMHSGYPIMTHLDAASDMTIEAKLRAGSWGLFHELGHNHQKPEWTFEGTGEVTCNLFSLYIMETVCGQPVSAGHGALAPAARAERTAKHIDTGAAFKAWKADPFLALEMYIQLREAFGWEPFKRVFAEYTALPPAERPKPDDARRDQWMVRMSRATGRNLGPFFQAWGVPTTESARASVADLPAWMPPGLSR